MDESWMSRGLCREVVMSGGTDYWFPPEPGDPDYRSTPGGGEVIKRYNQGRRICARCSIRAQCLNFAMLNGIEHGMWGGHTPGQRGVRVRQKKAS